MARLTIEQTDAPDFSASSAMLARAGESFNTGLESAKGILGKYNEGQQAKDDMIAINEIAKQRDEGGLDKLLASGFLTNLNLSETLRSNISNIRSDVIGNVNDRDSNSRANAGEGRIAAEELDRVNARTERRALTPSAVAAHNEASQFGTGSGNVVFSDVETKYNLPSGYLATTSQIESGGNPDARNPNSSAGGLFQQLDSNAEAYGVANKFDPAQSTEGAARFAVDNANALRKVLGREPTGAELYLAHQQGGGGASALLRNPNALASSIVGADAVSLNGGDPNMTAGEFAGLWINKYNKISGTQPVTSNQIGGQGYQDFSSAVASSLYMDPTEAVSLLEGSLNAQRAGQGRIDAAEALRQQEGAAAQQLAAIQDPNNISVADVTGDLTTNNPYNLSPTNVVNNAIAGTGLAANQLNSILTPAVSENPLLAQANADQKAQEERAASIDPTLVAFETAKAFETADDVGTAVATKFDLPNEGVTSADNINKEVSRFAGRNGLTEGEAGAVYAAMAEKGLKMDELLQATPDDEIYKVMTNTANTMFSQEARDAAEAKNSENIALESSRASYQGDILEAKVSAAKLEPGSEKRAQAEAKIKKAEIAAIAVNQPEKTKAAAISFLTKNISNFDPNMLGAMTSAQKQKLVQFIESSGISEEEKMLYTIGLQL